MTANDNRAAGASFEELFRRQCLLAGLWAEKNHLKAQRMWNGRLQAMPSNLDFTVIDRKGRVGFFDAKNFDSEHFTFSEISGHQVELAARYNEWGVAAGFVVLFRPTDSVLFYSGRHVKTLGPGTRFTGRDGVWLGTWPTFDPRTLLTWSSGSSCSMVP